MVTSTSLTSGCKRGPLNFSKKGIVLKRAKIKLIVDLPLTCEVVASLLRCHWQPMISDSFVDCCASSDTEFDENLEASSFSSSIFAPAADGAESVWEQWKISLDITCLCGAKQTAKHKAYKLYTWFKFFCHCALEKYSKIHRVGEWELIMEPLNVLVGDFIATQTGLHCPPPLSRKKEVYKHWPYAKRCISNTQRHKTHPIIIACAQ